MNSGFIFTTAFITGFVMMGFEVFGTRVLSPYFGSGLHVWGALIAVVMGGLSCGYAAGGIMADRGRTRSMLIYSLGIAGLLLLLFPCFSIFVCRWIDSFQLGRKPSTLLAALLLFLLPSFFIGCVSPLLVKLKIRNLDKVGEGSGIIYSVMTMGSIAGTLASAFYMIGRVSSSKSILLFGIMLLLNAVTLLICYRRNSVYEGEVNR